MRVDNLWTVCGKTGFYGFASSQIHELIEYLLYCFFLGVWGAAGTDLRGAKR
jgi:hypothetical protein